MKLYQKIIILIIATTMLIFIALLMGNRIISPGDFLDLIFQNEKNTMYNIVLHLRLPRIIMAMVVGASLSISGTLFQSILKNPLADPYIIGVSGGAALGATIAIVSELPSGFIITLAFLGSFIVISIVYLISSRQKFGSISLILSGIALSFILSSAVMLIFSLAKSREVHRVLMWLMGDLSIARFDLLLPLSIVSIVAALISMIFHKHLDIISIGESFSKSTGITEGNIKIIFWTASILTAVTVSLAGVIGFVGLIIPHTIRTIFGPSHIKVIPLSAIAGAIFLMSCDTLGRTIAPPYEIPVGIITGFFGGIFFLFYINKSTV